MPKAYLVDADLFEKFKSMAGPVIAEYGGKVLASNPNPDHREGDLRGVTVLIEFETMEMARKFYESDAYNAARLVREKGADTDLMLVEGL